MIEDFGLMIDDCRLAIEDFGMMIGKLRIETGPKFQQSTIDNNQ